MRVRTAAIIGFLASLALTLGLAQETANCDQSRFDIHRDCRIDSGDQLELAYAIAMGTRIVPTWTPSVTSTPTATNTPTPGTPAPSTYTVEDLIFDSAGPHDDLVCIPSSWDWYARGVIQGSSPGTNAAGTGWGVFQWADCNIHIAGVRVQVRNVRAYVYTDRWILYASGSPWCASFNPDTVTGGGACDGADGDWAMPDAPKSVHWGTWQSGLPMGTQCQAVMGEARATGGQVMMDFGGDWWPFVGATSGNGGAVVGRYRLLSETWLFFGASSCPADVLRSVGLP